MLEKEKIMNKAFDYLGRVTIPKEFRDRLGISPEDKVRVTCANGKIILEPVKNFCALCGTSDSLIYTLYDKRNINLCDECLKVVQNYVANRR